MVTDIVQERSILARQGIVRHLVPFLLTAALLLAGWTSAFYLQGFAHLAHQGKAFVHGSLTYVQEFPYWTHDSSVSRGGKLYWAASPFVSALLAPLTLVVLPEEAELSLHMIISPLVMLLAFALARQQRYSVIDAWWLALAFTFGSLFLGIAFNSRSWQLASGVGVILGLFFLYELTAKQRWWLLGLLTAAAAGTRPTIAIVMALLGVVFALPKRKQKNPSLVLAQFLIPIVLGGALLMGLHFARTGNVWDTGYASAIVHPDIASLRQQFGLFSLKHVLTNTYHSFFAAPVPSVNQETMHLIPPFVRGGWTIGFFWISPLFLWLFTALFTTREQRVLGWACLVGLAINLSFYAVNSFEFGPRYLVDILPFAFLLLLQVFPSQQLLVRHKVVIATAALANTYLMIGLIT